VYLGSVGRNRALGLVPLVLVAICSHCGGTTSETGNAHQDAASGGVGGNALDSGEDADVIEDDAGEAGAPPSDGGCDSVDCNASCLQSCADNGIGYCVDGGCKCECFV
jgi:hypothetical protein